MYKLNNREVEIEVSGFGDEVMIESGYYVDNGEELDDEEMDELLDAYGCDIAQGQVERYADDLYDRMGDR
jgi:hypothetical protein